MKTPTYRMKKFFIALGLLGAFTSTASAQSNVAIYGIVDVGLQYNDFANGTSNRGVVSGHQSGSRFGFRGSEELSKDLAAIFVLEVGYSIDTGVTTLTTAGTGGVSPPPGQTFTAANISRLFSRQAFGGLRGSWGQLVAGRFGVFSSGTGSIDFFVSVDPFTTGWGLASMASTFASIGPALRADNTVAYTSPTWGGFRAGLAYSFNISGQEFAGSDNNVRLTAAGASFARGPFYIVVTHDSFNYPGGPNERHLQVGATYDFKVVKLHAAFAKQDHVRQFATPVTPPPIGGTAPTFNASGTEFDSWMLGVTVPLGGGNVLFSYQDKRSDRYQLTATTFFEPDRKVYSLGYAYPLSRRTNLYFAAVESDAGGTLVNGPLDQRQYSVGIRHLF